VNRRRFLKYIVSVGIASGLASYIITSRFSERVLKVYDQSASFVKEIQNPLIKDFENKYNVKVILVEGDAEQLVSKFAIEHKNNLDSADVITVWDPVGMLKLRKQGFLENYVPESLDDKILDEHKRPILIQHWGVLALAYNPSKINKFNLRPPKSFKDLQNKEYKSKIILVDPIADKSALRLLSFWVNSLNYGWEFIERLKENDVLLTPKWTAPNGPPEYIIDETSDISLGVAGWGRAYPLELKGKPIKAVIPLEGGLGSPQVVGISSFSKNKDLARVYVEEVLFNKSLLEWWTLKNYLPVSVNGIKAPKEIPKPEDIREIDYEWTEENELNLRLRWQRIFSEA